MGFHRNESDNQPAHRPSSDASPSVLAQQLHHMFLDMGCRSERAGELKSALALYRRAVAMQPDSAIAWYNLGDALLALQRPEEAIPALTTATELSPGVPLYHYDLGMALCQVNRHEEARTEFAAVIAEDPQLVRGSSGVVTGAMNALALIEEALGRPEEGVKILTPAIRTAFQILYNIGHLNLRARKPEQALPFLSAATLVAPDNEVAVHGMGYALMELRRYRDAVPCLERATKLDPSCESAWYDLGVCLSRRGKRDKARTCFRKTLALNPQHAWAYYDIACLDALQGKRLSAFTNLEKALANGFDGAAQLRRDKDLRSLWKDPKWQALLTQLGNEHMHVEKKTK